MVSLQAELLATLLAGSSGLLWLGIRHFRKQSSAITEPCKEHEDSHAQQETPDAHEETFQAPDSFSFQEHKVGVRVELHGLQKAAELNGSFGVVLSYDADSCRYGVRKEMALAGENATLTVKASSLRAAPRLDTLAALQELVDSAPAGARVMLARGTITVEKEAADHQQQEGQPAGGSGKSGGGASNARQPKQMLLIKSAITLAGMGSRTGGTTLGFGVDLDVGVVGELVELSNFHVKGSVDISPRDVKRLRISRVSISAAGGETALYLDEISRKIPKDEEAAGRVLLEDCWVRGGTVGVWINAVGAVLRHCRVQGADTYGVQSNAAFAIEACTIGECAKSGRGAGILTRASVVQLRGKNGVNDNRVQRDCYDKEYLGYSADCRGCVGQCSCSAMFLLSAMVGGEGLIKWGEQGKGLWQKF
jgi:hypothetical protein